MTTHGGRAKAASLAGIALATSGMLMLASGCENEADARLRHGIECVGAGGRWIASTGWAPAQCVFDCRTEVAP